VGVVDEVVEACAVVVGACVVGEEVRVPVPGALVRVAAEEAVWQAVEALLVRASTVPTSEAIDRRRQVAGRQTAPTSPVVRSGIWGIVTLTPARAT
jgi:hypothetical protein